MNTLASTLWRVLSLTRSLTLYVASGVENSWIKFFVSLRAARNFRLSLLSHSTSAEWGKWWWWNHNVVFMNINRGLLLVKNVKGKTLPSVVPCHFSSSAPARRDSLLIHSRRENYSLANWVFSPIKLPPFPLSRGSFSVGNWALLARCAEGHKI